MDRAASSFHGGLNYKAYEYLGAHPLRQNETDGFVFRTWAPNAVDVAVVGDFCGWELPGRNMAKITAEGVYEVFIEGIRVYDNYKYAVTTRFGEVILKADPFAFHSETRPANASKAYALSHFLWSDDEYLGKRDALSSYSLPMNVYEIHLGSWRTHADGNFLNYRDIADQLADYVSDMGYTHVELLPVAEHPYDGSWGYQVSGYFAPTSRYGTPHDFMYFVDRMHRNGVGVILDWVPSHFPRDAFGLARYDGGVCFEDPNTRRGEHREWGTLIFDFGRREVQSFLISSAVFWFDYYHVDGLRVDAVASMLYLNYNREKDAVTNTFGGNENLEALDLIRKINTAVFLDYPSALMIAEESTAWPLVTKPVVDGGLGFNYKWNMGWMNDLMDYLSMDPFFRKDNHDKITFSFLYAFSENYVLPISHDEVVHGKCSLINKMPGEYSQKFAGLRAFMCYMTAHPGKKLLFMGQEFAQFIEWDYKKQLDWFLLDYDSHRIFRDFVKALNHFYLATPPLFEIESGWEGFRWICADDSRQNIISFLRNDRTGNSIIAVINFSPVERRGYRIGVPKPGRYEVLFSSENFDTKNAPDRPCHYQSSNNPLHGFDNSIDIEIPQFGGLFIQVPDSES
ncbi:MAG: 1,4-alpha-glucan branching protein GlgB [Oscillospiraceae bacterium]|nr:1,4-alpha-glucan branching protein GlgB [Oscillospiraceae bacterium]